MLSLQKKICLCVKKLELNMCCMYAYVCIFIDCNFRFKIACICI